MIYFIEDVIQTDLGDGWSWLWGFGSGFGLKWWWQSFGSWRDWGWLFVTLETGNEMVGGITYGGVCGPHWKK